MDARKFVRRVSLEVERGVRERERAGRRDREVIFWGRVDLLGNFIFLVEC